MRKAKYFIPLFILFLTIGFATVNQTLSIKGSATNQSNIDDFTVYFSDVLVNNIQDLSLVRNSKELVFTTTLEELGNQYKITYDITNGSKYFDAAFVISCTQSNNYLKITNQIEMSNLTALETRTGNLTLEKTQTNAAEENTKYTVTCAITATPVERETTQEGEAAESIFFEFDVTSVNGGKTATYQAVKGMTWRDWINSEYNVDNFTILEENQYGYIIFGEFDINYSPIFLWDDYGEEDYIRTNADDPIDYNIDYKWAIVV